MQGSEEDLARHSEYVGICSVRDGQPWEAPEQGIGVRNCACFKVCIPETVIAVINSSALAQDIGQIHMGGRERRGIGKIELSFRLFLKHAV